MKLAIVGYGKMGRLIEQLAPEHEFTVHACINQASDLQQARGADVAVEFTEYCAVGGNLHALAALKIPMVIGTTGWQFKERALHEIAIRAGIGILVSANFAPSMPIFQQVVEAAAAKFASRRDCRASIHESHHPSKKDAPSGTALMLQSAMIRAGYWRPIDISWTRDGAAGSHTVKFEDGPGEIVTFKHEVSDRAVFARGALEAAQWIVTRRGFYTRRE